MTGYKVFNPDFTCRGFKYEVGKTYKHDGPLSICHSGFHFCREVADCFNYYSFDPKNKVAEIEATGLVESDGDKSVTNEITIVREIPWEEMLAIANTGKGCTGLKNTGDWNTGDRNTGNYNTGDRNTGDWNTGDGNTGNGNTGICNTGDRNTGDWNTGNYNTGICNTGDGNTGDRNTGIWNTGDRNTGDRNTGDRNTGICNTGDRNTGDRNTGICNTGDRNTGDWNTGDGNTGFFSTITPKVTLFEKPTDMTCDEVCKIPGMRVLDWNYENNWWIYSQNMTEEEKTAHPEHETLGGYLKSIPFKDACALMWKNLTEGEKAQVKAIPNFDADIFYRITGIETSETCAFCRFCDGIADTQLGACAYCVVDGKAREADTTPKDCHLIPVPDLGRLIDADALRQAMYHEAFETDSPMQKWDSGCWIRYKMFERMEEAAPTVIPASGGSENE